jgi:hypothetical protein
VVVVVMFGVMLSSENPGEAGVAGLALALARPDARSPGDRERCRGRERSGHRRVAAGARESERVTEIWVCCWSVPFVALLFASFYFRKEIEH